MQNTNRKTPDVFSAAELARATRRPLPEVEAWIEAGAIRPLPVGDGVTWLARAEAIRAGRALIEGTIGAFVSMSHDDTDLFESRQSASTRSFRAPLAVSSSLHVAALAALILVTTLGLGATTSTESAIEPEPLRLVYLATPGPGGGGGGGGLRQIVKPPKAQRKGAAHIDSPLPKREPPPPVDPPKPEPEPPKVDPEPLPPVQAPVVEAPANDRDRAGVMAPSPTTTDSRGPGENGGVGTGSGTGIGEGQGSGIGEGEGGGTGGGPYRPGSGITPPTLVREVKPDYTEEARRRAVRGEVVMEIVVRRDGAVGDVKVLQGLGYGLDERAVAAVKQWKFNPGTRKGTPVDVMVEVAMEFKLR